MQLRLQRVQARLPRPELRAARIDLAALGVQLRGPRGQLRFPPLESSLQLSVRPRLSLMVRTLRGQSLFKGAELGLPGIEILGASIEFLTPGVETGVGGRQFRLAPLQLGFRLRLPRFRFGRARRLDRRHFVVNRRGGLGWLDRSAAWLVARLGPRARIRDPRVDHRQLCRSHGEAVAAARVAVQAQRPPADRRQVGARDLVLRQQLFAHEPPQRVERLRRRQVVFAAAEHDQEDAVVLLRRAEGGLADRDALGLAVQRGRRREHQAQHAMRQHGLQ